MEEKTKKILMLAGAIVVAIAIVFVGVMTVQVKGSKIVKNTSVDGVNLGGMTKEEAKKELGAKYKLKDMKCSYDGKTWNLTPEQIDLSYDPNKTVENAFQVNRSAGFFSNLKKTIASDFGRKNKVVPALNYDQAKLTAELEKMAKEIDRDKKDAYVDIKDEKITIVDEVSGQKLNLLGSEDIMKKNMEKAKFESKLVVDVVKADITKEDLKTINTKLGGYTTTFSTGQVSRSKNIEIAANSLNNVIIKPGETFSFNNTTGKRSKANGYKSAPVIENGEMKQDYGGGVCQVSSTLYNSVLYSGVDIVNVKNHTIPSHYVPKGRDATVADSGIDFLFKNSYKTPIVIKAYVSGGAIHTSIYGNDADKKNVDITTSLVGSSSAGSKKVNDPTLPVGTTKVDKNPRSSYSVLTYRIFKDEKGNVVKKEKVASSYYPKKEGVILVGTMQVQPKPQTPSKPSNDGGGSNSGGGSGSGGDSGASTPPSSEGGGESE
ncbi:MAG: VanW family protein [Clostridioides sp.]|jgi:vancomycin resistance protein YoaR|nr:VanW family protein [Clostridioides sp.]